MVSDRVNRWVQGMVSERVNRRVQGINIRVRYNLSIRAIEGCAWEFMFAWKSKIRLNKRAKSWVIKLMIKEWVVSKIRSKCVPTE